jgi:hypothetical protein
MSGDGVHGERVIAIVALSRRRSRQPQLVL